jgi:hypothetical protein
MSNDYNILFGHQTSGVKVTIVLEGGQGLRYTNDGSDNIIAQSVSENGQTDASYMFNLTSLSLSNEVSSVVFRREGINDAPLTPPRITSLRFNPGSQQVDTITIGSNLNVGPLLLEGMFEESEHQSTDPEFDGVEHWKDTITSTRQMFKNSSSITHFGPGGNSVLSTFPNVTNIDEMFSGCTSLTDVNLIPVTPDTPLAENLESMVGTFEGCILLTGSSTTWTIGSPPPPFRKLKTIERAFKGSGITNLADKTAIDRHLFSNATFDSLQSMEETFFGCPNLETVDLSSAKMPKIQNLRRTFSGCPKLDLVAFPESGPRINKNYVRDMTEFLFYSPHVRGFAKLGEDSIVIQRNHANGFILNHANTFFVRGSHAKRIPSTRMIERAPAPVLQIHPESAKALQDFVRQKLSQRQKRSQRSLPPAINLKIRFLNR